MIKKFSNFLTGLKTENVGGSMAGVKNKVIFQKSWKIFEPVTNTHINQKLKYSSNLNNLSKLL